MAVSLYNPNGAVGIADGGTPRVITIKARANISGGYLVVGSSADGAVGSGAVDYAAGDIEGYSLTGLTSGCIGMALQDIASGTYGPVAMRGIFLMPVASGTKIGSVCAGVKVAAYGPGQVITCGSSTLQDFESGKQFDIGRAITGGGGAANQFVAVSLNI